MRHLLSYRLWLAVFFGSILAVFTCGSQVESAAPSYLQTLIERARGQHLADTRMWHLLLHYKPRLFGGVKSEADGAGFFFHPRGKVDPYGELEATLRAFFSSAQANGQDEQWQHPQCRFPARYHWLKTQLGFDPQQLPERSCPRFMAWQRALAPHSVSLIFASYFLSSPASMFGHTFLRLNHAQQQGAQTLLDYGVNYAAVTTTQNGFLFALFGITGGFKGQFANFPYYMKVQEYSNLDSRDLWEYNLHFSQAQIDRMVRHLWELGSTYFRYYFFQENCSYHILSLLEVANPDLHLTDRFIFQVIPADTVRLITKQPGLIHNVVYRPSLLSQFAQKRRTMRRGEVKLLQSSLATRSLQSIDTAQLAAERQALVLDAGIDIMRYRKLAQGNVLSSEDTVFRQEILLQRSHLGVVLPTELDTLRPSRPDLGHGTSRLRLAVGLDADTTFLELSFPSFHDLLDPDEGFPPHSHIQLLTLTLRYYIEDQTPDVERFDVVRITALSPIDAFVKKLSWRVDVGYHTLRDLDCGRCHWFKAEAGAGWAVRLGRSDANLAYAFANLETGLSHAFDAYFRLSPSLMVGLMVHPWHRWTLDIGASVYYPLLGDDSLYYRNYLHQQVNFTRHLGVRLEINQYKTTIEGLAALHIYF